MSKILVNSQTESVSRYNSCAQLAWSYLLALDNSTVCLIEASTNEVLTIKELKSGANAMAVALIERGITKTDKIAFCGQNSIQHSLLLFATHLLGNTLFEMNSRLNYNDVKKEILSAGATIIATSVQDLHKFDDILNTDKNFVKFVVVFGGKHDTYLSCEQLLEEGRDQTLDRIPYFDSDLDDIQLLIHTTGTIERPKCAMISHRALMNACLVDMNSRTKQGQMITAMMAPFGTMNGFFANITTIMSGSTLVVFEEGMAEEMLFRSIEKYRINTLSSTPYWTQMLLRSPFADKYDLSSLKSYHSYGYRSQGYVTKALVDKYGLSFVEGYEMTENCNTVCHTNPYEEHIPGCVGRVVIGTALKIVDLKTGQTMGAGIEGEIRIRGNKLFSGYLNSFATNREAFDRDGWYRTGDMGYFDEKERVFITDRLVSYIRVNEGDGVEHICPSDVEKLLLTHKSIAEVVVIGVDNKRAGNQLPFAYIQLKDGQTVSAEEIHKYVSDILTHIKQLKFKVVFVDHIHRTCVEKVDRKYYRNLVRDEEVIQKFD